MALISKPIFVLLAGLLHAGYAWASQPSTIDMSSLAKSKVCLGCHQVEGKRVGPSFVQVAQRHAGQPGAEDYLASAIRQGGKGRWGAVPMPAQPQVSEEDARRLAQWILTLKPTEKQ